MSFNEYLVTARVLNMDKLGSSDTRFRVRAKNREHALLLAPFTEWSPEELLSVEVTLMRRNVNEG